MKFSEGPSETKNIISNERFVDVVGGTEKMSKEDKNKYLNEYGWGMTQNTDFITVEEYKDIFKELDVNNKSMAFVGAGFSLGKNNIPGPFFTSLMIMNPTLQFIPIDTNEQRLKSWHILDTKDSNITINPVVSDGLILPLLDESVDIYGSVNLINEPKRYGEETLFTEGIVYEGYRVLKPGGTMILSSFGYFLYTPKIGPSYYNDGMKGKQIIDSNTIWRYLKQAGFSEIKELPLDKDLIKLFEEKRGQEISIKKTVETTVTCVNPCAFLATK